MYTLKHRPLFTAAFACLLTCLGAGCSQPKDDAISHSSASSASSVTTVSAASMPSRLGDLTEFRSIALDVQAMVAKSDLPAAKARIKDLEMAWDSAEAGLKPRAADDWHLLDKAIDHALSTLRADAPRSDQCAAAMTSLLQAFDTLQGQKLL